MESLLKVESFTVDINEKVTAEVAVEDIYKIIKRGVKYKILDSKSVGAIAELTTELANRLKVEEDCG